jgi:hypothetical protein
MGTGGTGARRAAQVGRQRRDHQTGQDQRRAHDCVGIGHLRD